MADHPVGVPGAIGDVTDWCQAYHDGKLSLDELNDLFAGLDWKPEPRTEPSADAKAREQAAADNEFDSQMYPGTATELALCRSTGLRSRNECLHEARAMWERRGPIPQGGGRDA